jgi:hypothetical protein
MTKPMPKLSHKQKDKAVEQLLSFIMNIRRQAVDEAMFTYFLEKVKENKNFKFDKATKKEFFYWLRQDEDDLKNAWNSCASSVFKDASISKELIDIFFDNYIDLLEKQWNKTNFNKANNANKKAKS